MCSLTMKHTRVVSTKCTPGFAGRALVTPLSCVSLSMNTQPSVPLSLVQIMAGILLIRTLGTNFSEILSVIHAFSFKKMHLKMSSAKWRPFCLGLSVLRLDHGTMVCAVCFVMFLVTFSLQAHILKRCGTMSNQLQICYQLNVGTPSVASTC